MPEPFPFIVGSNRSGTTLLRALLDSHPRLAVPPESYFVVSLARERERYEAGAGFDADRFASDLAGHRRFERWAVPEAELRQALDQAAPRTYPEAIRTVYALYAGRRGKPRFADKTPKYVSDIGQLASLFPESRFVHIIRDGRDTVLSYMDLEWGPSTVVEAAHRWRSLVSSGREQGRELGAERYLELRYEELVADPEAALRPVCEFIALDFDTAMFDYVDRAEEIVAPNFHPDAHERIFLPPTQRLRDWRSEMSPEDRGRFDLVAGELLTELGYERDGAPVDVDLRADVAKLLDEIAQLRERNERLRARLRGRPD